MDKGLKILGELQKKLDILIDEKSIKQDNLKEVTDKIVDEEIALETLEEGLKDLNDSKKFAEEAPKIYKEERNEFIKILTIVALIIFAICSIYVGINAAVGKLGMDYFLKQVALIGIVDPFIACTLGGLFLKSYKKAYKTRDISEIEKDIEENELKLENSKGKMNELVKERNDLETATTNITNEINEIMSKIDSISALRAKVIEEFCEENLELDNLLDNAYDEEFEKNSIQKRK